MNLDRGEDWGLSPKISNIQMLGRGWEREVSI